MKIIDTHAHIFPTAIAQAATTATAGFYATGKTPIQLDIQGLIHHSGTVESLIKAEKNAGVSECLVFSAATTPKQVESINSFVAKTCKENEGLMGAGTMHADYQDFEKECDRMISLGLRGIKLHPDIQKFAVDDDRLLPLYEIMSAKHLFLITHAGDNRFDFSGPKRILRLAKDFPKLKIIGAHFTGWSQWDEAREILRLDNIFMDTSSTIQFAGPETAVKAFQAFDNTHIFFGTDYPMWDPKEELETIEALNLDDKTFEGVMHSNFELFMKEL